MNLSSWKKVYPMHQTVTLNENKQTNHFKLKKLQIKKISNILEWKLNKAHLTQGLKSTIKGQENLLLFIKN